MIQNQNRSTPYNYHSVQPRHKHKEKLAENWNKLSQRGNELLLPQLTTRDFFGMRLNGRVNKLLGESCFPTRMQPKKRHFLRESGGFGEQYHLEKPATMETWAGSNHGQTLVRLLEIRGACFKTSSGGLQMYSQ